MDILVGVTGDWMIDLSGACCLSEEYRSSIWQEGQVVEKRIHLAAGLMDGGDDGAAIPG